MSDRPSLITPEEEAERTRLRKVEAKAHRDLSRAKSAYQRAQSKVYQHDDTVRREAKSRSLWLHIHRRDRDGSTRIGTVYICQADEEALWVTEAPFNPSYCLTPQGGTWQGVRSGLEVWVDSSDVEEIRAKWLALQEER